MSLNERINWKSICAGLIVILIGTLGIVFDLFMWKTPTNVGINVGCSLIASGLVIVLIDVFVDRVKENPLDIWGIKAIYPSRIKMNDDCEVSMKKAKHQVDVVAFGLSSYREDQPKMTQELLRRGVNFQILTMNPDSPFVDQREQEENNATGQIKKSIQELIKWADKLNASGYKGKICIKGYSCMTLDFYWRVDDEIYVGPYWYSKNSQKTISYKFGDGKGFEIYTKYFESLWNDSDLTVPLTKNT